MGHHFEIKQALVRAGWSCDEETKLWSHAAYGVHGLSFKEAAIHAIEKGVREGRDLD